MSGIPSRDSRSITRSDVTSVREFVHGFAANQQQTKKDAMAVLAYGLAGAVIATAVNQRKRGR